MLVAKPSDRNGLSLTEVLIAFFILAIGIVGVISLFPVGISQVRQAVNDTRSTIVAMNAESTLEMFDWPNDAYLLSPPNNIEPPADPLLDLGAIQPNNYNPQTRVSAYAGIHARTNAPPVSFASPGNGFPIYVDPVLFNSREFPSTATTGYRRVEIKRDAVDPASLPVIPGFDQAYEDLAIFTVSDAQLLPVTVSIGGTPSIVDRRSSFLRHWFFSDADISFETQNPIIPENVNRGLPAAARLKPWEYHQTTLPPVNSPTENPLEARPSADRGLQYSWSFVISGRPIVSTSYPTVSIDHSWRQYASILVFHSRNFADPYRLCRGCFFNGSKVATLSWPVTGTGPLGRPNIRRGTWLMEYTNTGPNRTMPGANQPIHRQKITFHRVASFAEPRLEGTGTNANWVQSVTLDQAVADSDFPTHQLGDLRSAPDLFAAPVTASLDPASPAPVGPRIFGNTPSAPAVTVQTVSGTTPTPNTFVWVPVIIWDGLIEVFKVRD